MLKSLFIVNSANDVLYQRHFERIMDKGVLVPFYDKCLLIFFVFLSLVTTQQYREIPPVINCNTYSIFHICHELPTNSVYFIAITTTDVPPLFVVTFLNRIKVILRYSYNEGKYNDNTLKQDFIRLTQILDQTADGGFPFITEPNIIDSLLGNSSLSQKLERVVLGDLSVDYDKDSLGPRSLPWRKDGVVYSKNEILFDVNEHLSTVYNLVTGKSSRTEVVGEVICQCGLSGVPDVSLRFENPQIMDDVSFHPCIRINKWEQQKILSFVPPDGKFTLFNYRVRGSLTAPIKMGGNIKYSPEKGDVELSVYANNIPGLTQGQLKGEVINMALVIHFPSSITSCSLLVNCGSFTFNSEKHELTWNIGKHNPKIVPTISGTVNRSMYDDLDTFTMVSLQFQIINHAASGLRFKHLDCNQPYNIRKGVKFTTFNGRYSIKL